MSVCALSSWGEEGVCQLLKPLWGENNAELWGTSLGLGAPVTAIANFARTNHFTPPREMPACTFAFPMQFNQPSQDQNTWANLDFSMLSSFKKACTLYGPTSPYCIEFLGGWADHWMPYDFFSNSKDNSKSSTATSMANMG